MRDADHIRNNAVYLAIGVTLQGNKEPLGLWIAKTEGTKFWLQVKAAPPLMPQPQTARLHHDGYCRPLPLTQSVCVNPPIRVCP